MGRSWSEVISFFFLIFFFPLFSEDGFRDGYKRERNALFLAGDRFMNV